MINIVVSVVITTASGALLGGIREFNTIAVIIGAAGGFILGTVSAFNNRCIKICGTGYCNTSHDDCYTSKYLTELFKYD